MFYKFATRSSKRRPTVLAPTTSTLAVHRLTMDMSAESAHGLGVDGGLV